MCGISASIDWGSGASLQAAILRMHAQIPHRGPDGEGFLLVDAHYRPLASRHAGEVRDIQLTQPLRLGIGFRWLKIQDLGENAAQPMCSPDHAVWVALNGEIYNFPELRAALRSQGYRFTTHSDTEVVLAAYQTWGTACFARFSGMWAMVIVDLRDGHKKVLVSRDRFGIKPLFYCYDGTRLLLASEVKQIIATLSGRVQANLRIVRNFLHGTHVHHGEETFFTAIRALPPATYAVIDMAVPQPEPLVCKSYWHLADFFCPDARRALPFHEACAGLDERLRVSVMEHMAAQVPVGSLLSGGLDSSVVSAMLAEFSSCWSVPPVSFSFVLPEHPEIDEAPHIATVSKHLKLRNVHTSLNAAWVKEQMPKIAWTQEEPLLGMAWIAQYRTYQLAAEHGVRVVLDGQGADEVLAGYVSHQDVLMRDWLLHLRLGNLARELWADPRGFCAGARRAVLAPVWHRLGFRASRRSYDWLARGGAALVSRSCSDGHPCAPSRDPSRLNQLLYNQVYSGNLKTVLAVGDRNSMAHTIESRVPYLDHRLVEFAFQLPESYKAGASRRKRILRHVAGRYLPASVVNRRDRIGFGIPQRQWLQEALRKALYDAVHSTVFRASPLCDRGRLAAFVTDFYAGRHHDAMAIWRIYALWQWAEVYNVVLA